MFDNGVIRQATTGSACAKLQSPKMGLALPEAGAACRVSLAATAGRPRGPCTEPVGHVASPPPGVFRSPRVKDRSRPAYLIGSRRYYRAEGEWAREPSRRKLRAPRRERCWAEAVWLSAARVEAPRAPATAGCCGAEGA